MNIIKVTSKQLATIDTFLRKGSKIDAIKFLRDTAREAPSADVLATLPSAIGGSSIGLKEAKDAVERRWNEVNFGDPISLSASNESRIVTKNPIKRIVVDMGDGEVELDMEGMSLKFLMGLTTVGLAEVASLCDLYKRIKDWEE